MFDCRQPWYWLIEVFIARYKFLDVYSKNLILVYQYIISVKLKIIRLNLKDNFFYFAIYINYLNVFYASQLVKLGYII